jgi:hypothetical protein
MENPQSRSPNPGWSPCVILSVQRNKKYQFPLVYPLRRPRSVTFHHSPLTNSPPYRILRIAPIKKIKTGKKVLSEDDDKIMTKKRLRNTEVTGMLPHVSAETVPCILCHFVRSSGKIPYRHEFVQALFCARFLIRIESLIPSGRLAGRDFYVTDKTIDNNA